MNLETNKNNINFDLISELFFDKFKEKISKKLKDDKISGYCNVIVKTIRKNNNIHIVFIEQNANNAEDNYENDEDVDKYFNDNNTHYIIAINEFKVNILKFQATKQTTYFEAILHSENIMMSLVNETMQEIKNEISNIKITNADIEHYMNTIKSKPKYQHLPYNVKPIKIYATTYDNSDKVLIKLIYKSNITFSAIYDNGNFKDIKIKDIKINIKNQHYERITVQIQKVVKALKAFQYYLYNNYNTGNVLYERKYKELIDELWGK